MDARKKMKTADGVKPSITTTDSASVNGALWERRNAKWKPELPGEKTLNRLECDEEIDALSMMVPVSGIMRDGTRWKVNAWGRKQQYKCTCHNLFCYC